MTSVIKDLYLGRISPTENLLPKSAEQKQLQRSFGEKYQHFSQLLQCVRPDLKLLYDELCELELLLDETNAEQLFQQGFSYGLMFVIEAMIIAQGGQL